jgi:hypothetical protein
MVDNSDEDDIGDEDNTNDEGDTCSEDDTDEKDDVGNNTDGSHPEVGRNSYHTANPSVMETAGGLRDEEVPLHMEREVENGHGAEEAPQKPTGKKRRKREAKHVKPHSSYPTRSKRKASMEAKQRVLRPRTQ